MSDEPKVTIAQDNGNKMQWGRNLLYFRDASKWTIDRKLLTGIISTLVVVLGFMQMVGSPKNMAVVDGIPILPGSSVEQKSISFDRGQTASQGPSKKGAIQRFAAPKIVLRPKDLKLIPPGSFLGATLLMGASNGPVRAEVKEPLNLNGDTLIEKGAILLGTGSSSEERLFIAFNQVVFRNGTFGQIRAQACDKSDQIVGLKGSKIGTRAMSIAGGIGLGFVGGFAEGLQEQRGEQGATVRPPSLKNALLNATAVTAIEQSQSLMSDLKNKQPIMEVPTGTDICVIIEGGE